MQKKPFEKKGSSHPKVLHSAVPYQAYRLAPGYLDWLLSPGPGPIIVAGGPIGPPRPRALPLPLPGVVPGMAKSGFATLACRITSSGLIGRRPPPPPPPPPYGPNCPAAAPISGLQLGFTGRCETDVKCDVSDAAGEREPSGRSS